MKGFDQQQLRNFKYIFLSVFVFGLISLSQVPNLYLSNDFRVYFSTDNPQLTAFDDFESEFVSHDSIAIVGHITDKDSHWLDANKRNIISKTTDKLWQVDFVTRVNSVANYSYTLADEDSLVTQPLFEMSQSKQRLLTLIAQDSQLKHSLLSSDGSLMMIQANVLLPEGNSTATKTVVSQASAIIEQLSTKHPSIDFYLIGSLVSNITLEQAVQQDLINLVPLSYLIITIGLLYFLRSIKATVVTLTVITISVIFTFSIFAIFKGELTPVAGFVPSVVLTLAVADCVHYLTSYRHAITHDGHDALQANKEAYEINLIPISITSITTIIGVLFLNFSDSPPYRDLGNMVAIGVLLAWIFTVTLLPWLLAKWPIDYQQSNGSSANFKRYANWIERNYQWVFLSLFISIGIFTYGLTKNNITESWSEYFTEQFDIAKATKLLQEKFNRLHRYELVLSIEQDSGINTPSYLAKLDKLLAYLQSDKRVQHIQSYGLTLKRLNQNMHGDDISYYRMPSSRELAAQYLLIYELSLPAGLGADSFVNFDRTATRTSVLLSPMDTKGLIQFEQDLQEFVNNNITTSEKTPLIAFQMSGMDQIFAHIVQRNVISLLIGSGLALIVISLLMIMVLKSVKYGLISLVPNIMPALIAYGIWGFTKGYIDLALSVVVCMSLGIIVDDSVHFLTKYYRAKKHNNKTTHQAMAYAFEV
ncbi:MAG: efflux RND transporter permease subunit, partial [Kangiellaceae bacterium]|nr:efflux RND transporter permease subunit [Kangiellaceae bacterium]